MAALRRRGTGDFVLCRPWSERRCRPGVSAHRARAWLPRLAGIAGFLIIVGLAGLIVRLGLLRSLIVRWPAVFGVGFGLAWWLWLSPSAVGLAYRAGRVVVQILAAETTWEAGSGWRLNARDGSDRDRSLAGSSPGGDGGGDGSTPWTRNIWRSRAASVRAFIVP